MSPPLFRATMALVAVVFLAACGEVRADGSGAAAAGSTPAPEATRPPTLPHPVSADALAAPADRLIAEGPGVRVEQVRLNAPVSVAGHSLREVFRVTVSGRFALRDMPLTILVGGSPAGQAVEARDLKSAVVALPDRTRITNGAVVSYRYGSGPVTVVGKLKVVR